MHESELQKQLVEFFSQLLKDKSIRNFAFLLVFRSDYIGLLEKLSLPPLLQGDNWNEIPPFTERAAQEFMQGSGLQVSDRLLANVLWEAADIEQTRGLIRPITINLCGLVLARFASGLPRGFRPRGLIRGFLRESISLTGVPEIGIRLISQLITNHVTKRPRTIIELARYTGLEPVATRGCLRVLGQPDRSIVRPLDADQQIWEISHDFLVPLLDSIVARWRTSLWRRSRPWLPWIAVVILAAATMVASNWRKDPIVALTDMGWSVQKTQDGLSLGYSGEPPEESLDALQRIRLPLSIKLDSLFIKPRHAQPATSGLPPVMGRAHDISEWSVLTNFHKLDLAYSRIESIERLRGLTSISELDLTGTPVSDIEPLNKLTNLRKLTLTGTAVKELAPLKQLVDLDELDISDTPVRELEPLRDLKHLSILDLCQNSVISFEPLKSLTSLRILYIGSPCEGCDSTIEDLLGNKNLKIYERLGSGPSTLLKPLK